MGNIAWTAALEECEYNVKDARLYCSFKQLLKLLTRQRDKQQMMDLLYDGTTSSLLKDIVTIFYEPLARVYKAANIHNSITDLSHFIDDTIATVSKAESTPPAQLVTLFIDLVGRHQNSFYKFVHSAHSHDDGLFESLMSWIESILSFLRDGTGEVVDIDSLVTPAILVEVDEYIAHLKKQKHLAHSKRRGTPQSFSGTDFGIRADDLDEFLESEDEEDEEGDILMNELRRREVLRSKPKEPQMTETTKLVPQFKEILRDKLANQ